MLLLLLRCIEDRAVHSYLRLVRRLCRLPLCLSRFPVCSTPVDLEHQATTSPLDLIDLLDSHLVFLPFTVLATVDLRNLPPDDSLNLRHLSVCHLVYRPDRSEWVSQVSRNHALHQSAQWTNSRHLISDLAHFRPPEHTSCLLSSTRCLWLIRTRIRIQPSHRILLQDLLARLKLFLRLSVDHLYTQTLQLIRIEPARLFLKK